MNAAVMSQDLEIFAGRDPISQVVTFKVDGRLFGTRVEMVREIRGWQPTTPLPNAAPHVLGALNLRGAIIAVYDLRTWLGLGSSERTRSSVVIVVSVADRLAGILADAVSDILDVAPDDLRRCPDALDGGPVQSLVVKGDHVITLLELERIIGI